MTYWCEYAWVDGVAVAGVRVEVTDGRLASVVQGPARAGDERLAGLTLPGMANAHSHAFHRGLRGRTHDGGGTFWTWRTAMYALAAGLDPDLVLALARAAFAEMVLAGYTVVGEFHYLHHRPGGARYDDPNAMGHALVQAATEAGIRLTLLDACYLTGGFDTPLEGAQLRFGDGSVEGWRTRVEGLRDSALVRHGVAAHSVRAVPVDALTVVAGHPGPRHVHLSEQPAENEACLAVHGCTPTELLARAGFLGAGACAVHATHLTPADIGLLAGTAVCLCPTTERDLADGIGPARELSAASSLCLGSDQHAVIDPFEELRGMEAHERLRSLERGRFTPSALVSAATAQGYAALGWAEGGVLRTGALADLTVVRLDSVRTAGAVPGQAVLAACAPDVTDVVVGGRRVVQRSEHVLGDVAALLTRAVQDAWAAASR